MPPFIIARISAIQGSSPRERGACMLIAATATLGTIGGGKLEYAVLQQARKLLQTDSGERTAGTAAALPADSASAVCYQETFTLGPALGQCCGGTVSITYELCHDPQHWQHPDQQSADAFPVIIFGAGHVGSALVRVLTTLPCQLHWLDSRPDMFPSGLPDTVHCYTEVAPAARVAELPQNGYYLVMTHDHALDLELCEHILCRADARFIGLIGSKTKYARFRHQLQKRGFSPRELDRIQCPIGIPQLSGKQPAHIALAVAAQLLAVYEQNLAEETE